jgi:hypothetical protein
MDDKGTVIIGGHTFTEDHHESCVHCDQTIAAAALRLATPCLGGLGSIFAGFGGQD